MNTSALIDAEIAVDLESLTRLSEAAIIHEAMTSGITSVFVVLGGRGDRSGFDAEILAADGSGRIRAVARIAVLLVAPDDQVATVRRDLLREGLDLTGAFAELTADERYVGCEARPFSWIEGLYRDSLRRRFARRRLIATLRAITMQAREKGGL